MSQSEATASRLLERFVERLGSDARLAEFARTARDAALDFDVPDAGAAFHLRFAGGGVEAGMGTADGDAVLLRLPLALLDAVLCGRREAMQAVLAGELSFSGDADRAATLAQIQADLSRVYRETRAEVGAPPGLGAPARPDTPAAPADLPAEVCRIVEELYAARLITSTGGNVSARLPDHPEQAWITPSHLFKGDLRPESLVRIDLEGRAIGSATRAPSSEALVHAAVLRARPEVQAVIHCHAPHATILVDADLPFLPISTEAAFVHDLGRIPFVMPGTRDLADAVAEALGRSWGVLMKNHGLLVAGRSLRRAADLAEIVERTCQVIVGCYAVGREPSVLPPETVETLKRYGDLMA